MCRFKVHSQSADTHGVVQRSVLNGPTARDVGCTTLSYSRITPTHVRNIAYLLIIMKNLLISTCILITLLYVLVVGSAQDIQQPNKLMYNKLIQTAKAIMTEKFHEAAIQFDGLIGDEESKAHHEEALLILRANSKVDENLSNGDSLDIAMTDPSSPINKI
jgi:hypothetical protein